jgi:hypothetical protein
MIMMRLKVVGKIDGGVVKKSNLLALVKMTIVGNSNSGKAIKKKM